MVDLKRIECLCELAERMGVEPQEAVSLACGLYAWALEHVENGVKVGAWQSETREDGVVVMTAAEEVRLVRKPELRLVKP